MEITNLLNEKERFISLHMNDFDSHETFERLLDIIGLERTDSTDYQHINIMLLSADTME